MMLLTRIDDRLIHGQVVEGWVGFLKATCVVVADDAVAANPVQRSIMEISAPEGLRVVIGSVEEACRRLASAELAAERIIVLFSNPADVVRALNLGASWPAVNLGGMHYIPGKQKLLDVLAVDEKDMGALKEILGRGIKVDIQKVPTDKPQPLERVLKVCRIEV